MKGHKHTVHVTPYWTIFIAKLPYSSNKCYEAWLDWGIVIEHSIVTICALTTSTSTACNITDCPRGSQCKIHEPTGEPFCEPSCDLDNGGCADNETCSLRNVTCARAPCPPVVECSSE